MAMSTQETLLAAFEWLDSEGYIVGDAEGCGLGPSPSDKTHDDLAREFIQQWEARPGTATLAGRPHIRGRAAVDLLPEQPHPDSQRAGFDFDGKRI